MPDRQQQQQQDTSPPSSRSTSTSSENNSDPFASHHALPQQNQQHPQGSPRDPMSPTTPHHFQHDETTPLAMAAAGSGSGSGSGSSTPATPSTPTPQPFPRTQSVGSFVPSPLNPASPPIVPNPFARPPKVSPTPTPTRPDSRASSNLISRHTYAASPSPTAEMHEFPGMPITTQQHQRQSTYNSSSLALDMAAAGHLSSYSTGLGGGDNNRGSMVLYRLADDSSTIGPRDSVLMPPRFGKGHQPRSSVVSSSGDSVMSFSSESKYPSGISPANTAPRGFVPYAYDPAMDELDDHDEEDMLHDPGSKIKKQNQSTFPWRGIVNVFSLILLTLGLMLLFIFYPVFTFVRNDARNLAIDGNIHINGTGQAPQLFGMPGLIDKETPDSAKSRKGWDGQDYELVFSDEFNEEGRSFYPGDDPYWEAVDLWYGATADLEWYDPRQVTTRDGSLVITMDSTATTQAGQTPGSSAPFTKDQNHQLDYRSGMLQSWNKFCFSSGYIETAVILPGPNSNTKGYWPGAWTMGNLGRPGYMGTTDGMWPYSYDSCDVGTYPNQTNKDGITPAAAHNSQMSKEKYNFELSWLSGQRLSSCSCPNSDHPGPAVNKGRGAPEIDIFEAEIDKATGVGQVVSQSAQFAPFSHDYVYGNTSADQFVIYDSAKTIPNTYHGSAVQQAVSSLSKVPDAGFQGAPNRQYVVYGFEYWANPSNRGEGFITWGSNGAQDYRMGASAVGPDQDPTVGTGVGARLVPEEPMSVILNLGISQNWQDPDLTTMIFPAEMLIDYVRVYQRKGSTNIGCDPKDYPTKTYIDNHIEAYTNANKTTWDWPKPVNSLYNGGC